MICGVLLVNDLKSFNMQLLKVYEQNPAMLEIRLDALSEINISEIDKILQTIPIPYVLSLRSEWYNEEITPPNEGRIPFLREMISLKPSYLSFEFPMDIPLLKYLEAPTIPVISLVDFEGIAKIAFNSSLDVLNKYPSAILKISATPNNASDILTIWRWAKSLTKKGIKHIVLGMGPLGTITRLKSREFGNLWTYGRLDLILEEPRMPGMVSIQTLNRAFKEDANHFLGMSNGINTPSEMIFKEMITNYGLPAVYIDQQVHQIPELDQILMLVRDNLFQGVYVNVPWHEELVSSLENRDHSVIYTGQCNVIVPTKDGLRGYNTLVETVSNLLEPHMDGVKRVFIDGINLGILNYLTALRNYDIDQIVIRADDLGLIEFFKQVNNKVISIEDSYFESYDMFINCQIPHPGFEKVLSVHNSILDNCKVFIDQLSTPESPTPLANYAIQNQIQIINGWEIYIKSLTIAMELWTGEKLPVNLKSTMKQNQIPFTPNDLMN